MPIIAQYIGGAGTGKTTHLMNTMDKVLGRLHDPHLIGFASFTRAAIGEAVRRASDRFDIPPKHLELDGWFHTVHSTCFKLLGVRRDEMVTTDTAEGRRWLSEALDEDLGSQGGDESADFSEPLAGFSDAAEALKLWDRARNRLLPLADVWAVADECDMRTPPLDYCESIADRYEQAKRLDGRCDFVDLLTRFAGWSCDVEGVTRCTAEGMPPELPVWFFDEQQDSTPLQHSVCQRLISADETQWVYIVGDPFQSIYGWGGADSRCFMHQWPVSKRKIMPKSYRCAPAILRFGEEILRECSDYWDRGIQPADHEGTVEVQSFGNGLCDEIDPRDSWLLLARTNRLAAKFAAKLDKSGVPWRGVKGNSKWTAPVRNEAIKALLSLECGAPIDGTQWQAVLKNITVSVEGVAMLARGTKAFYVSMSADEAQDRHVCVFPNQLSLLGATAALQEAIASRRWRQWIKGVDTFDAAVRRWGQEAVDNPGVQIGTIHSVKGAEADNVAVLSSLSMPCAKAAQSVEGFDEEQRVWYVAATRARERLIILNELKPHARKRLPI